MKLTEFKVCRSEERVFIRKEGDTKEYFDTVSLVKDYPEFSEENDELLFFRREMLKMQERYERMKEKQQNERTIS